MEDLIFATVSKLINSKRPHIFLTVGSVEYFYVLVGLRRLSDLLRPEFSKLTISDIARLGSSY